MRARSAGDLVLTLRRRELTAADLISECLGHIDRFRHLNAFLWADAETVLARASVRPIGGTLAGLPVALKDNIDTAAIPTTSGSEVDRHRIPEVDAAAWARLRDRAGATLLGKAHLCEFAYRVHHPSFGWVRNPRRRDRATGGSSSGSAAAVAAGLAPVALGSDTGGSVRIPAAYCGVVGLKGTQGLVENEGLVPLSRTMDHFGVLAACVSDAALIFDQMLPAPQQLIEKTTLRVRPADPRGLRIGIELGYFGTHAQPAVLDAWSRAIRSLESAGCRVVEVQLPEAARWRSAHKVILVSEAWGYHATRLRAGAPYGPVFRAAVGVGAQVTIDRHHQALTIRQKACRRLADVFRTIDILVTPTCPAVAPPTEEGRHGVRYTRFTTMAAFTGIPAISIPCGQDQHGLPIGAQLMARWGNDKELVRAAALLESLVESSIGRN